MLREEWLKEPFVFWAEPGRKFRHDVDLTNPSTPARISRADCRMKSPGRCISADRNLFRIFSAQRREDRDARLRRRNKWRAGPSSGARVSILRPLRLLPEK